MSETSNPLYRSGYPRSNGYDPEWIMDHQMGPNPLWLAEWLCMGMELKPEMRVLDLGCGTALTSIFLAREFGVRVWAADLWLNPDENWQRVLEAGAEDRVFPVKAEAHALPFAAGFFDAVVSVDTYQYFGTDLLYLDYLTRFVRPGGQLGVVVPGIMKPFEDGVPEHLTRKQANGHVFWEDSCICFLTPERWREIWGACGQIELKIADVQPDGCKLWHDFEVVLEEAGKNDPFPSVAETLAADAGEYLGFVRLVADRKDVGAAFNLYDPALVANMKAAGFGAK